MATMRKRIWSGGFNPSQRQSDQTGFFSSLPSGDAAELQLLGPNVPGLPSFGKAVLGDTSLPSQACCETSHASITWAAWRRGALGRPGMLLLIRFAASYTQGL